MLRFGLAAILVTFGGMTTASAQSESAASLATPPIRGARYVPPTTDALPPPTTGDAFGALPPPTSTAPQPWATGSNPLAPGNGGLSDPISARMIVLDQHLSSLGVRRTSTIGSGVVSTIMGGAFIGIGVYANRNGAPSIAKYFYITGVASLLGAGLSFGLSTNASRSYEEFALIRDDTSLSPGERLRRSEAVLHRMARRKMISRFAQGGLSITVAAVSLPFLLGDDGFDRSDGYDWLIGASALIGVITGVTTMFQRTEEERRWRMYTQFANSHGGDTVYASRLRLQRVAVSPIPGGGFAGAAFIF